MTKLKTNQLEDLGRKLNAAFSRSPVLAGLGVQVRAARGRFYVERVVGDRVVSWGRITPVVKDGPLLLECESRTDQWYEVARGGLPKIVKTITRDTRGTFHGLGALDASLRAAKRGLARQEVRPVGEDFVYAESGQPCTAQEALFHYFGIPLNVLIQPRRWYAFHRKPYIVEYAPDRSRVLVSFCTSTFEGSIIGTCLYVRHGPEPQADDPGAAERAGWAAYTIRPNASDTIATAEQWLVKRKWRSWT